MAGGSRSQRRRFLGLSSKLSPANRVRACRWVRLGPTLPAAPASPLIVWQPEQPLATKSWAPAAASATGSMPTAGVVSAEVAADELAPVAEALAPPVPVWAAAVVVVVDDVV